MEESKRKIGILTFHCSNNYGAVLQVFALKTVLELAYSDSEICVIDYQCEETVTKTKFIDIVKKRGVKGAILHYPQIRSIANRFNRFREKRLNLTKLYLNKTELAADVDSYDAIISGSDQVWNRKWSGNDDVYFQDFHCVKEKKYSYAASFGFDKFPVAESELYKDYLADFTVLSLRESSAVELIKNELKMDAVRHIDPTLLLSADEWNKVALDSVGIKKYILVYMVPFQKSVIDCALQLRKNTGLSIVMLSKNLKPFNVKHKGNASPEEFIGLFKNAEYVVTNSFHGTAFSLIYHKKLKLELNNLRGVNIRSKELLELCGIDFQMPSEGNILSLDNIDWNAVQGKINQERVKSLHYLASIVGQTGGT